MSNNRKESDLTNSNGGGQTKVDSADKISNNLSDSIVVEKAKKKSKKRKMSNDTEDEVLKVEGERSIPVGKQRRARNSIILYRDHDKAKKTKKIKSDEENQKNEEEDNNDNNIALNNNRPPRASMEKKTKSRTKKTKDGRVVTKRVLFMEPNFVEIIDVESYKQFNLENTSKDPYYDDVQEGKDNVKCTCAIF